MKIGTDPLCPKCGEEEETAYHLLARCNAMTMARYSILDGYYGTSTSSSTHSFDICKSLEEIYITFWLSRGCALGQN